MVQVMNEHAPIKSKLVRNAQVPYMNGELRRAINYKNMLRRKYERNNNKVYWERYRKFRNHVTCLRKKSKSQYLKQKCNDAKASKTFWSVVKPLISDKCKASQENVILSEGDVIINEPFHACNVFNEFYNTVAADIGQSAADILQCENNEDFDGYISDVIKRYNTHPSVNYIRDNSSRLDSFCFSKVSVGDICK
jgi:hypothetical protein